MTTYTLPPRPQPPASELEAEATMVRILSEIANRVNYHEAGFRAFWGAGETPDARVDALNSQRVNLANGESVPAAGIYLAFASENLRHLATLAGIISQPLDSLIDPSSYAPPRTLTANPDGTVTLGPILDGCDAWGNALPVEAPATDL